MMKYKSGDVIDSFSGDNYFLSNFYGSLIRMNDGIVYPSGEAAFQAQKTLDMSIRRKIAMMPMPGAAKRIGRHVVLRSDWEEIKRDVMVDVVKRKFEQNPELAAQLLATYPASLVEGNTWNDRYWGVCNGDGQNKLGRILERVRNELLQ